MALDYTRFVPVINTLTCEYNLFQGNGHAYNYWYDSKWKIFHINFFTHLETPIANEAVIPGVTNPIAPAEPAEVPCVFMNSEYVAEIGVLRLNTDKTITFLSYSQHSASNIYCSFSQANYNISANA